MAEANSGESGVGRLSIRLLGSFHISIDDVPRTISIPAQRLLAMLALNHESAAERALAAGTLWPDSTETAARSNLRSALSSLGSLRGAILETVPNGLQLAQPLRVDLHERRERAHRLLDPSFDDDDAPLSAFTDDLLPQWDEVWVEHERESFRQLRLHVLEYLSERLAGAGRYAEAMEAALLAVEGAPIRESAHRAVIHVLAAEGNRGEAMSRYAELCAVLDRELGVGPSFQIEDAMGEATTAYRGNLDAPRG